MSELINIKNLKVNLMSPRGIVHAVRDINLEIAQGQIHGLVGESGCGKSMTAKSIMRLHDEKKMLYGGEIIYEGNTDILTMKEKELEQIRGKDISMIFQDPMTTLNPLLRIGKQLDEMILQHEKVSKAEAKERSLKLLEKVGIFPAEQRYKQYPFELSGGMLQRVSIAMAIACNPKLLIADESTTALDVTVQAQILRLIKELQEQNGMSVLVITHNFGVIAEICDVVSVMYAEVIVEHGPVGEIFHNPKHPYTMDLIQSIPKSGERGGKLVTIPGTPPDLRRKIVGCAYAERCKYATDACRESAPQLESCGENHEFACKHKFA
ncbi:MAG: ABC transporter ATP-binding protein [Lachnospiraceae bacterium]|nr:ABC transporter ATP-binding protein [Lachnospiraceae bacterium]